MVDQLDQGLETPCVSMDVFLDQTNATAVRIEPDEDARLLLPHLDRLTLIEVAFPKFRDGRGYSAARILREAGFTGTLRAQGDVLIDQLSHMKRCGFDAFAPDEPLNPDHVETALNTWPEFYQMAADKAVPIWKLRHG
ncbi:MAG TPA: DUF934 domain-containing protein [Sphingopyxis sp.]|nr:DUF934 domain-containing protein [Sphingopyxis sp.]